MADTYQQMLERARKHLPANIDKSGRFEIPKAIGHVQGNRTIINNFAQIADAFRRDKQLLLKFLQRELATPAEIDGPRLIFGRKLSSAQVNAKIDFFAKELVLCKDCKKPDTNLIKADKVMFIKCTACGAKHVVRGRI